VFILPSVGAQQGALDIVNTKSSSTILLEQEIGKKPRGGTFFPFEQRA
jgi:hypothetical protein